MLAKLSAVCLAATAILGAAAALPPYVPPNGLAYVGPQLTPCSSPQALGSGGGAAGAASYHSYLNAVAPTVLDGCVVPPNLAFPGCAAGAATTDATLGASQVLTLTLTGILAGLNTATSGASDAYQRDCGGLVGTGSDGEFEFGSRAAALNVREGLGIEPLVFLGRIWGGVPGGDGIDACIDPKATPHHALDTTVFVEDLISGGSVGFTLAADWARPAGLSNDNTDRNTRPGIPHCGDGAVEPCEIDAHAGIRNDLVFHGGAAAVVGDVTHVLATPTDLMHALDVVFGCNPLDTVAYKPAAPLETSPVNAMNPPGALLADFGNGGASGWLLVVVDPAPATAGWVWTGA